MQCHCVCDISSSLPLILQFYTIFLLCSGPQRSKCLIPDMCHKSKGSEIVNPGMYLQNSGEETLNVSF